MTTSDEFAARAPQSNSWQTAKSAYNEAATVGSRQERQLRGALRALGSRLNLWRPHRFLLALGS